MASNINNSQDFGHVQNLFDNPYDLMIRKQLQKKGLTFKHNFSPHDGTSGGFKGRRRKSAPLFLKSLASLLSL